MNARTLDPAHHLIEKEPYYESVGDEIQLFEAAYRQQIPVLLKGPTGCGKTRFMEHMAWRLKRPLITVSCHDDLTASDLVGRYLVKGGETVWVDGPLTRAVRCGGICYLDEIVEARKDTMVVIHPLADDRRTLPMEKLGQMVEAPPEFCLAISYNPGYQSVLKDLKQSTRQRFVALEFDYPSAALERRIVATESGVSDAIADSLVRFAQMTRNLKGSGLEEGASTRLLVHAGKLIADGISPVTACKSAVAQAVTDDADMLKRSRSCPPPSSDGHSRDRSEMEASLHVWLETEFTYFKVEQLAAELEVLTRDEQDFILGWIRRIASTHITLAWQFGRRAPALLPRMERRLLEAWAVHTCDVFDRTGLQTALRVMEEVDTFDETQRQKRCGRRAVRGRRAGAG